MKKTPILLLISTILAVASSMLSAQKDAVHIARDGDRMHPGLALSPNLILSVNGSSRTVLLNPEAVSFRESLDASAYIDGDTISYVQAATKHRFILNSDTLSYLGFENRATDFRLDSAVKVARFQLLEGDTVCDKWSGHILHHGSMLLKRMTGISTSRVESGWDITDGIDTIRNAKRLIWILDMAYADTDSIDTLMPDSIASSMISDMRLEVEAALSERLLTVRSLWFSEDARYPVLTDSRVSRIMQDKDPECTDTVPLTMLAMYYPASFQHADTGEEIMAQKSKDQTGETGFSEYGFEDGDAGNSLSIGEPEVSGGAVSVSLSSPSGIRRATITVFADSGMRLTEPMEVALGTLPQSYTIHIPDGWTGAILLRVEAGDESYTCKTII